MPAASARKSKGGAYRTPLHKRFAAGVIDLIVCGLPLIGGIWFGTLYRVLGALLTVLLTLLKDRLPIKQGMVSPGKKALGLNVEAVKARDEGVTAIASVIRNLPLAVGPMILAYPSSKAFVTVLGLMFWAFSLLVEGLIIFRDPEGRRLGDQMAGTKVFD